MKTVTLWFLGIPEAGKSVLAKAVFNTLTQRHRRVELLDSDQTALELGPFFSCDDFGRDLNNHTMAMIAKRLNFHGIDAIVASTTPFEETRNKIRGIIPNYIEVYCKCPAEIAEQRDSKHLYAYADLGFLPDFSRMIETFEEPENSEIVVESGKNTAEENSLAVIQWLIRENYIEQS